MSKYGRECAYVMFYPHPPLPNKKKKDSMKYFAFSGPAKSVEDHDIQTACCKWKRGKFDSQGFVTMYLLLHVCQIGATSFEMTG